MSQIGVLVTWRELTGETPTMAMLDGRLAEFRLSAVLLGIARLTALLKTWQNEPSPTVDRELARRILPTFYDRIRRIYERNSDCVTFTRLNLLFVAKQACRVCAVEGRDIATSQDAEQVFSCCLLASDLLLEREPTAADTTIAKAANLLPFANYVPRDSYPTDLARNLLIIEEIAPLLAGRGDYVDITAAFVTATGITPQTFGKLAFSTAIKFITNLETQLNDPTGFLLTQQYFQHAAVAPQDVTTFLARSSTTSEALHELGQRQTAGADFLAFQRYPLVQYEASTYLCLDPGFLLDKAGRSLYWTLHEATERTHNLLTYWSGLIERYAHWLFSQTYQGRGEQMAAPTFTNGDEACDICLVEGSALVLIEVKASILTVQAKYGFSSDTLQRELLSKTIAGEDGERKGVAQLSRSLQRFLDGDEIQGINRAAITTIYPVLVFLDHSLTGPYLNRVYNEHFDSPGLRRQYRRRITPLFSLTIDDLENVLPHTHQHAFTEILYSYYRANENMFGDLSHSSVPILRGKSVGRDPVRERFKRFGDDLEQYLFPGARPT